MATALQFGAGNIGRGFIGQLFSESGYEVVFVDVVQQVVDLLCEKRSYVITIADEPETRVVVENVRAVNGRSKEAVVRELASCDIAATAVGANVLPTVADPIAEGIRLRKSERPESFLNIIVCENLRDAAGLLRSLVHRKLDGETLEWAREMIGFSQAVVGRMVPLRTDAEKLEDPIGVRVEAYKKLPVDVDALKGPLPQIEGVLPKSNFQAYIDQKLFSHNCGHAAAAYFGAEAGLEYIWEAMEHPEVRRITEQVMSETSRALVSRYGIGDDEQQAHVRDLIHRFSNKALSDTVARVGSDPLRKLGRDDRLVGAGLFCLEQGVEPFAVVQAIAAALRFVNPEDESACALQKMLKEKGLAATLSEVSGLDAESKLGKMIREKLDAGAA